MYCVKGIKWTYFPFTIHHLINLQSVLGQWLMNQKRSVAMNALSSLKCTLWCFIHCVSNIADTSLCRIVCYMRNVRSVFVYSVTWGCIFVHHLMLSRIMTLKSWGNLIFCSFLVSSFFFQFWPCEAIYSHISPLHLICCHFQQALDIESQHCPSEGLLTGPSALQHHGITSS